MSAPTFVIVAQQGVTTRYTQDLASPLSQILSDGTTTSIYGMERLYGVASSTRIWYASDALGSVRQTLSDSGSVLGAQHYDPWGQPQRATIAPFGFTGELQQGASVYLRARWYNAGSGTFGSRDAFAGRAETPNTLAPYTYGANSPVMLSDPSGRCYAPIAFLRDVEPLNCSNLDAALRIAKNPQAGASDQLAANGYIVAFAFSHAAALVGAGVLAGSAASGTGALITAVSQWGSAHILAGTGVGSTLSAGGTVLGIAGTADTLYQASQGNPMAQAFLACPGAYGAATLWNDVGAFGAAGLASMRHLGASRQMSLIGFRGVGLSNSIFSEEPTLIKAGHVGISFDGKTVYGFSPSSEAIAWLEQLHIAGKGPSLSDFLKEGGALRGQLQDDTAVFQRAAELARNGARTQVWQQVIDISERDFARITGLVRQQLTNGSSYPSWYRFPETGEPMPPQCNNCATWPRTLGLPIPEMTGQLREYIALLEKQGISWP